MSFLIRRNSTTVFSLPSTKMRVHFSTLRDRLRFCPFLLSQACARIFDLDIRPFRSRSHITAILVLGPPAVMIFATLSLPSWLGKSETGKTSPFLPPIVRFFFPPFSPPLGPYIPRLLSSFEYTLCLLHNVGSPADRRVLP